MYCIERDLAVIATMQLDGQRGLVVVVIVAINFERPRCLVRIQARIVQKEIFEMEVWKLYSFSYQLLSAGVAQNAHVVVLSCLNFDCLRALVRNARIEEIEMFEMQVWKVLRFSYQLLSVWMAQSTLLLSYYSFCFYHGQQASSGSE